MNLGILTFFFFCFRFDYVWAESWTRLKLLQYEGHFGKSAPVSQTLLTEIFREKHADVTIIILFIVL